MLGTGRRFKIVSVRGIPLYVSMSWLVLVAIILLADWSRVGPGEDAVRVVVLSTIELGLLFATVLIHEASHAVMARAFDVPVAGVTLTFWGGATETAADSRGPLGEFLISAAGPASTAILAGVFFLVADQMDPGQARGMVRWLAQLNLILAVLNVIPGYPLDGGRMLEATAWGLTRRRRTSLQVAGWSGMLVGGAMIAYAVFELGDGGLSGWTIWLFFIGMVLFGAGRSMRYRIAVRDKLTGGTVRDAMRPADGSIEAGASLSEALDRYLAPYPDRAFPVVDGGRVVGVVSLTAARRVGARDPLRPVRDAMRPLNQVAVLDPGDPLEDAFEWLAGRDGLVLDGGALVGMLGPADVQAWSDGGVARVPGPPPRRPDL